MNKIYCLTANHAKSLLAFQVAKFTLISITDKVGIQN